MNYFVVDNSLTTKVNLLGGDDINRRGELFNKSRAAASGCEARYEILRKYRICFLLYFESKNGNISGIFFCTVEKHGEI